MQCIIYILKGGLKMTVNDIEQYFGTLYKACQTIGITPQAATNWRKKGYIPMLQQYKFAEATKGELLPDKVDPVPNKYKRFKSKLSK